MGIGPKHTFFQRKHDQQEYKNVLNITRSHANVNQNHTELLPVRMLISKR